MNSPINPTMGPREWVMLLALSMLWGGAFFFVEVVVTELPPLTIVLSRVALAALALWGFVLFAGLRLPRGLAAWHAFFVMGLVNNVLPFSLIVWGQTEIASGHAAILNATTPIFTVLIAGAVLADERINARKVAGVLLGITGVGVMIGGAALRGYGAGVLAQFAVLGAACCYAIASVYGRRFRGMDLDPVVAAAGQVSASTLILVPIVLLLERPFAIVTPGASALGALLGLGLLSTALAYILYFRILAAAGATNVMLVTLLIPVSAILLGGLVLGEVLAPRHFVGMTLIGVGLLAIDGRLWRRLRGPRAGG